VQSTPLGGLKELETVYGEPESFGWAVSVLLEWFAGVLPLGRDEGPGFGTGRLGNWLACSLPGSRA
jgi:hypothetical protein